MASHSLFDSLQAPQRLPSLLACDTSGTAPSAAQGGSRNNGQASRFSDVSGLSRDICSSLLLDEATSDVALVVQGVRLHAHRPILSARSPVFRAMFFGPMKERNESEIQVNMFTVATMVLLLRFMYAGEVEEVCLEDMVPLMACADHYGVTALCDAIGAYLRESISPENSCSVLTLARTYKQENVVEWYLAFILMHAQEVMKTDACLQLDANVFMKILGSDAARIHEIDLFKALVRWYWHWVSEPEVQLDEAQAEKLFASIRYCQMTGPQLVSEVRPLVGNIVPHGLYVSALELAVAPDLAKTDEMKQKQGRRRLPPIGTIQVSDLLALSVRSATVEKVGAAGWNCTAVVEPSTARTRFVVENLVDPQNGLGVALFDTERNAFRVDGRGFPNPSQWGADCIAGIYGTGCFFGIITDHVLRWHAGIVIEVVLESVQGKKSLHVTFVIEDSTGERKTAEGILSVPQSTKLAMALFSPEDRVLVEPAW
mmetsp:Transcript_13985/g.38210  ORF Transcript_13985/g.38210 Transcript_13985/m.38210 type:complete len:485 (+) Transcript_13985:51-1505(+)